jgi:hypothetical protein
MGTSNKARDAVVVGCFLQKSQFFPGASVVSIVIADDCQDLKNLGKLPTGTCSIVMFAFLAIVMIKKNIVKWRGID